ncbi:MAG: acetyltransferase [Armatimonadetes bacterium]|nr:acetyltransferase [Armatimonadota bacterium]
MRRIREIRTIAALAVLALLLGGCNTGTGPSGITRVNPRGSSLPVQASPVYFIDPTATVQGALEISNDVFVGPFAEISTGASRVRIGAQTDIQDNASVDADVGREVDLGDRVILAHGASVRGPAVIGASGGLAAFVGFNALVDGGTVEPNAMVGIMARLGPGVRLRSGLKILPGKNVTTQTEADDPALGKVALVTGADMAFMDGVIAVNIDFARGYAAVQANNRLSVRGIGENPSTTLNPVPDTPTMDGVPTVNPFFRNRIIGEIHFEDSLALLDLRMGSRDSARADEGKEFRIGQLGGMADDVVIHALEHTSVFIGDGNVFGSGVIVHGGDDSGNVPHDTTRIEDGVTVGAGAVVFRATIGDNCVIGVRALVDGSQLAAGTVVADRAIIVKNVSLGFVEC